MPFDYNQKKVQVDKKVLTKMTLIHTALEFDNQIYKTKKSVLQAVETNKYDMTVDEKFDPQLSDIIEDEDCFILLVGKKFDNDVKVIKQELANGVYGIYHLYKWQRKEWTK